MGVWSAVVGFSLVAGLLTITPGLDTALVLRAAVTQGRRQAFAAALGINTGAFVWGAGASVGVSALLTASALAYTAVRVVGAAYMVWLGVRLLRGAIRRAPEDAEAEQDGPATGGARRAWRQGLLTNLLNPKVGAFYVAVLPQFIPPGTSPLAMGLLLALVHDIMGLLWFTLVILGAGKMGALMRRRSTQRAVDAGTGSVLIGFGLRLGLTAR